METAAEENQQERAQRRVLDKGWFDVVWNRVQL